MRFSSVDQVRHGQSICPPTVCVSEECDVFSGEAEKMLCEIQVWKFQIFGSENYDRLTV